MTSSTALGATRGGARGRADAGPYAIDVARSWGDVEGAWRGLPPESLPTGFQHADWLGAWYRTIGSRAEVEPVIVTARDAASGELALALPLVRRLRGRLRVIEFADLGVTDYNAPVVGPAAPGDAAGFRALWREVRRALPGADLLSLEKMPGELGARANPLALHGSASPSTLGGNVLHVPGAWEGWRRSLDRPVRKEIERSWRVFLKHDGAAFRVVEEAGEAGRVLARLSRLQSERVRELGLPYLLDEPAYDRFYGELLQGGLASGRVVLTALVAGEEVVAALLGIIEGRTYAMVRLGQAGGAWRNCSPGRLVIEGTMAALHARGVESFDFTIGDYPYKRRFGVAPRPLFEVAEALSMRGTGSVAARRLRALARQGRALARRIRSSSATSAEAPGRPGEPRRQERS